MKITTWVGLITGLAMVGAVLTKDLWKKEKLGESFKRPAKIEQILNQTYSLNLKYENGKESRENFRLSIELDRNTNTLYLGNYTKDYNKQDRTGKLEKIPAYAKHTRINPFSKTILIHPPEIKISSMDQKIYLVPQYSWDQKAKPYEEHEEAQKLIQGGEKIIDAVTGEIPIPFFKNLFDTWINSAKSKERGKIRELTDRIKAGYTATIIPSYIKHKLLGSVETAREYQINLDISQLTEKVPVYLMTRIILGDPSNAPSGSFPNKYGELETKIVEFSLKGNKTKSENIIIPMPQRTTNRNIAIFSAYATGQGMIHEIYICDFRTMEREILIKTPNKSEGRLSLSENGKKIAVLAEEIETKNGRYDIKDEGLFIVDIRGKKHIKLVSGKAMGIKFGGSPLWSSDNNHIFFYTRDYLKGNKDFVYEINITNNKIKKIRKKELPISRFGYHNLLFKSLNKEQKKWCLSGKRLWIRKDRS